ncbi:MAG TPA: hypothetical protein VHZ95_17940 [Polyangiales bacterium]|nr:hypothetical protein [Polyangiales bacterium]
MTLRPVGAAVGAVGVHVRTIGPQLRVLDVRGLPIGMANFALLLQRLLVARELSFIVRDCGRAPRRFVGSQLNAVRTHGRLVLLHVVFVLSHRLAFGVQCRAIDAHGLFVGSDVCRSGRISTN